MFTKRSRYLGTRRFEPHEDGSLPFKGVRARVIGPATPVLEHVLQPGERLDALGVHYFNDPYLWHRILDANPDLLCAAQLEIVGAPSLPRLRPGADEPPAPTSGSLADYGEILLIPRAKEGGA
ncbi:MAG: hypothetical protein JNK99_07805 [Candidatus Accumulibacter sp.]|uniref:hypothetical protein n=1 Tax=Accumulibacter sp. TaxID=2053492 RepID=UPI001A5E30F5|nr:hypothetical protein [Accumulibacter sp.]MBL8394637.1 hypothetical protein [Accumulibacter sp.]